jgi:hypothetical protein
LPAPGHGVLSETPPGLPAGDPSAGGPACVSLGGTFDVPGDDAGGVTGGVTGGVVFGSEGVIEGVFDGVFEGVFDGVFEGAFEGESEGALGVAAGGVGRGAGERFGAFGVSSDTSATGDPLWPRLVPSGSSVTDCGDPYAPVAELVPLG